MSRVLDWTAKTGLSPLCHDLHTNEQRWKGMEDKAERLVEEAQEMLDACKAKDGVKLLDGLLDVRFVFEQLLNDMQHYGFKTVESFEDVCDNNDLKTSTNFNWIAMQQALHTQRDGVKNYYIDSNEFDVQLWHCLKRFNDNKVSKPVDHPTVELDMYVPNDFKLKKEEAKLESKYLPPLWPTGEWMKDLRTKEEYDLLLSTGLAHEYYNDLPFSWEECVKIKEEKGNVV